MGSKTDLNSSCILQVTKQFPMVTVLAKELAKDWKMTSGPS